MIRKTFYVTKDLSGKLKEIAKVETNGNVTTIFNEFIEFAMFCYKMTKHYNLDVKDMFKFYKKGVLDHVDQQRRSDNHNNNSIDIKDIFD